MSLMSHDSFTHLSRTHTHTHRMARGVAAKTCLCLSHDSLIHVLIHVHLIHVPCTMPHEQLSHTHACHTHTHTRLSHTHTRLSHTHTHTYRIPRGLAAKTCQCPDRGTVFIDMRVFTCAATHSTELQHTATRYNALETTKGSRIRCVASSFFPVLQHTAVHCNTLHHTVAHYTAYMSLQRTAAHCNAL